MGDEKLGWWQRVDDRVHTWWQQADDWLRERLPEIDIIETHTDLKYAWIWKFTVDWKNNIVTISYLPDYEHARFEITIWPRRK